MTEFKVKEQPAGAIHVNLQVFVKEYPSSTWQLAGSLTMSPEQANDFKARFKFDEWENQGATILGVGNAGFDISGGE